jgi:hypothetical protein
LKALKFLFPVLFFLLISCGDDRNCGEIVQKFAENGKYYFAMIAFGGSSSNSDDPSGSDVFGDAEVTLEVYNSFNIGDEYCIN